MDSKKIICIILIPLLAILCVQLCLVRPETRELFTDIESAEGVTYGTVFKSPRRYVRLVLEKGMPSSDIAILYNSREISRFTQMSVTVVIECDGVFEIKNGSGEDIAVTVEGPENVDLKIVGYTIPVGIHALCSVRL